MSPPSDTAPSLAHDLMNVRRHTGPSTPHVNAGLEQLCGGRLKTSPCVVAPSLGRACYGCRPVSRLSDARRSLRSLTFGILAQLQAVADCRQIRRFPSKCDSHFKRGRTSAASARAPALGHDDGDGIHGRPAAAQSTDALVYYVLYVKCSGVVSDALIPTPAGARVEKRAWEGAHIRGGDNRQDPLTINRHCIEQSGCNPRAPGVLCSLRRITRPRAPANTELRSSCTTL